MMGRNSYSYCRYHRTHGHTIDDCWTLKQQIEQLIQRGNVKKFVKETERETVEGKFRRGNPVRKLEKGEGKNQRDIREEVEHANDDKGLVGFIAGGFSGGDATQPSKRMYVKHFMSINNAEELVAPEYPGITFDIQDFDGVWPHADNPIVISTTTSGFKIARVLVDGGSW